MAENDMTREEYQRCCEDPAYFFSNYALVKNDDGEWVKPDVEVFLPILYWTDDDVVEFIRERGIRVHPPLLPRGRHRRPQAPPRLHVLPAGILRVCDEDTLIHTHTYYPNVIFRIF